MASGNGTKPAKTPEEVTLDLRSRLEDKLGAEKTQAIWQDPHAVQTVIEGESEAADVAEIALAAWRDISPPDEEPEPEPKKRSRLGRLVRLLVFVAIIIAIISALKGRDDSGDDF